MNLMIDRYSRQVLFAPIGPGGQEKLAKSQVLLVGCGALGTVLAELLVRAGVGTLTIADRDFLELSNLQRQSLFTESDCQDELPKAVAAAAHLKRINSEVKIVDLVAEINAANVGQWVPGQDLILDGTDNFETRYLLNDASLKWQVPWVYGACVGSYGMSTVFLPGETACLRCILDPIPPPGSSPTCDTVGVIGPVVHAVAALQCGEALKILTGNSNKLGGKIITMDLWENRVTSTSLREAKRPDCPACGCEEFEFLDGNHETGTQTLCGRDAIQIWQPSTGPMDFRSISQRLDLVGKVRYNDYLLRATIEDKEIALFRDGRSIIRGTQDPDEARRLYAKYIGH